MNYDDTFKRYNSLFDKMFKVLLAHESCSTCSPQQHSWNPYLLCCVKSKSHGSIIYYAADLWHLTRVIQLTNEFIKWTQTIVTSGMAQCLNILTCIHAFCRRQAIGDGGKFEVRQAFHGGRASCFQESFMDVLGVDEGYVEAFVVEYNGQFEHGVDVALCWKGYTNSMRLMFCLW